MKKFLIPSLIALAVLASSCTKEETVDQLSGAVISFNATTHRVTRADAPPVTTENLTSVTLYGFNWSDSNNNPGTNVIDGTTLSKSGTNWTYSPLAYWIGNTSYRFVAINEGTIIGLGKDSWGSTTFTNTDGTKDVVWASASRETTIVTSEPAKVDLVFNHMLCRLKLTFTDGMPDNYSVTVSDVTVTGTHSAGTFTLGAPTTTSDYATGVWSATSGEYTASFTIDNLGTGYQYLIPETTDLEVNFTATLYHKNVKQADYAHTHTISNVALEQGKSYVITAALNKDNVDPDHALYEIQFSVDVNPYNDPDISIPW